MDKDIRLELIYEKYLHIDFLDLIKKYNLNYLEVLNYLREKPDFTGEVLYEGKSVDVDYFLYNYQKERGKFTVKRYLKLLDSKDEVDFSDSEHPALKKLYDITIERNTLLEKVEELNQEIASNKESNLNYIHKNIHKFDFLHMIKIGAITFEEVEEYLLPIIKEPIYIKMKDNILLLSRVKFLWHLLHLNLDNAEEVLTKLEVLKDICDFTDVVAYSKRIDLPILLTVYYLESVLNPDALVRCGKDLLPISELRETLLAEE